MIYFSEGIKFANEVTAESLSGIRGSSRLFHLIGIATPRRINLLEYVNSSYLPNLSPPFWNTTV